MANNNDSNNTIACKLCYKVFTNIRFLITHMESHMVEENLALSRLTNINPQFEAPPLAIPRPRMFSDMHAVVSHPLHVLQHGMPSAEENVAEMVLSPTSPTHQDYMEVSHIDETKPYINKLDKPIDKVIDNPAIVINDDTVNLELRL
ncbi:putative transcription factor C2H2 family [Medicago truncatula]|nr:putative transcription factor C2H2 family [Medicago truncatula]